MILSYAQNVSLDEEGINGKRFSIPVSTTTHTAHVESPSTIVECTNTFVKREDSEEKNSRSSPNSAPCFLTLGLT
jgi:hypothetical protein